MLWTDELSFSNWLHGSIDVLGASLHLRLIAKQREAPVGRLSADLLATLETNGKSVIIENQIHAANHGHFGQLLTYAAHYDAAVIIWIATSFRQEYRSAIAWLNALSEKNFYAVELVSAEEGRERFRLVAGPADAPIVVFDDASDVVRMQTSRGSGAFAPAPFAMPSDRNVSPGQLALNSIFEKIAQDLNNVGIFARLRNPTGDRNYYAFSAGPVKGSEWSIVFTNSEVRLELVFNDPSTAQTDLGLLEKHRLQIETAVNYPLDFDSIEGRAKQKLILRRPLTYDERQDDELKVAQWCAATVARLAAVVYDLRLP